MKAPMKTRHINADRQVDKRALAELMLQWEDRKALLDNTERMIIDGIKSLKKTHVVGNVRATYNSGRKKYDYESAALGVEDDDMEQIVDTYTVPKVDWKKVCGALEIPSDGIPFTQSDPSVTVKLDE